MPPKYAATPARYGSGRSRIAIRIDLLRLLRRSVLARPSVTTAILASLTVVLVSVTVIEVVLNRRSERRWRLLAQYTLLELAEAARAAWGVLLASSMTGAAAATTWLTPPVSSQVLHSPERAPQLKRKIEAILTDPHQSG